MTRYFSRCRTRKPYVLGSDSSRKPTTYRRTCKRSWYNSTETTIGTLKNTLSKSRSIIYCITKHRQPFQRHFLYQETRKRSSERTLKRSNKRNEVSQDGRRCFEESKKCRSRRRNPQSILWLSKILR